MPRGIQLNNEQAKIHYDKRLSDQDIADQIGVHKKSVARWRRSLKLPSNVPQGRPREKRR